jgi:hypothetical protein
MYKVGQPIWGIEVLDDNYEEAEVTGHLFMAECGDYIICTAEDISFECDFNGQLDDMYEESIEEDGIRMNMLKKDLCFPTRKQAYEYLVELKKS